MLRAIVAQSPGLRFTFFYMVIALLFAVQTAAVPIQAHEDDRPVRLWLGASPVSRGEALPVYVSAATEGYLLVLRAATDGHVEIVFPGDPKSSGAIGRGAYELRASNNRPALVASEPNGTGLVLAALSPTPFRYDEFLKAGAWNRDALVASWPGADGAGTLTDIVQRMLGDGWFTYDLAIYTVGPRAPRTVAPPVTVATAEPLVPGIGTCNGCTIVYQTVVQEPVVEQVVEPQTIVEPVLIATPSICDPFVGLCHRRRRDDRPRFKTEGICQIGVDCPPGAGTPAKAVFVPQRASLVMSPIGRPAPAPVQPASISPVVSVPVFRTAAQVVVPAPAGLGLSPGVRTANAPTVVSRTGGRFGMESGSGGRAPRQQPAPAAAPAARSGARTIALPRAIFRRP